MKIIVSYIQEGLSKLVELSKESECNITVRYTLFNCSGEKQAIGFGKWMMTPLCLS